MFKLIRRLVTLVVLLVIAAIVALVYIDSIAEAAIEKGGTYALGTEVSVDSTDVGLILGSFTVEGLNVANPKSIGDGTFLSVRKAEFDVGYNALRQDVVAIPRIAINGTRVNIESKDGKYNYEAILEQLKRFESDKSKSDDGKRFIIDDLSIGDTAVTTKGLPVPVPEVKVPDIVLKNVGRQDGRGVTIAELTNIIVKSVLGSSLGELAKIGALGDLAKDLQSRLGQLQKLDTIGVEVLGSLGGDIGKTIEGAISDTIGGGIDSIFGGKKK